MLGAITGIFSAVSAVSKLFSTGKEVIEKVTGKESKASTPEELKHEVEQMTPEQQEIWAKTMQQKIDLYKEENNRLDIQGGTITKELHSKLDSKAAGKIAILRQTTRPWAVRKMVHFIMFPFYLVTFDVAQLTVATWFGVPPDRIFKSFDYVFGSLTNEGIISKAVDAVFKTQGNTLAGEMYMSALAWVTGVIISYMTLREFGKTKGTSGDISKPSGITDALSSGLGLVGKIKSMFKK